jgi:hypothetical protein
MAAFLQFIGIAGVQASKNHGLTLCRNEPIPVNPKLAKFGDRLSQRLTSNEKEQ